MAVSPLSAQDSTSVPVSAKSPPTPASIMPPLPQSPVKFFRQLLAMKPQERRDYLTNRPPEIRERIFAKVSEYLALKPEERELRLNATELRWYLLPLLRESQTNRDARLAQVPDDFRDLVRSRLEQWDALPPQSRQEFLDNEQILHYFSHVDPTNVPPEPGAQRGPSDAEQARWQALSGDERQKITAQFNQFFELTPEEKQKTLNTLSDAERAQMEGTLQSFDKLPPAQRAQCIRAFTKFAGMSPVERAEFLKNAERWAQLPPKERQAWRDLVAQVPLWPSLPNALIMPPKPPVPRPPAQSPPPVRSMVATNQN
jgi:hypothetical protein